MSGSIRYGDWRPETEDREEQAQDFRPETSMSMPQNGNSLLRSGFGWLFCAVFFLMLSGPPSILAAANAQEPSKTMLSVGSTHPSLSDPDPGPLFAALSEGDTLRIGLREAVFMALERNPSVTIQRRMPDIASTFAWEERADFDPTINASGSRSRTEAQRRLGNLSTPVELIDDRSSFSVGVSNSLPTGTTISADAAMDGSVSSLYTDQYSGHVGVTLTQALLQGFGVSPNLARLRKARMDIDISKAELKGVAEQLAADVERAYWELYLAAEEIHIQRRSLGLADQQLEESLGRVAVGKLPELELAAVRAEGSARQGDLIDAQSTYEQARLRFLFLLNPPGDLMWALIPIPTDKPVVPADSLDDVALHEQLGMKYRPDLEQARLSLQKGRLELARTRNGLLPELDLFISLGRTSYAQSFRETTPELDSPFYDVNGGLAFTFPVPNRKARAQARRAKWSQEQLEWSLTNMTRLVQRDVRSAYIEVLRSKQQIKATRVTRELQESKWEAELEKFRVGKSTNFLVLQAQRDVTASHLNEARARAFCLNALTDLYLMEGTLLDRRGIDASSER
ncbi:MAG: TolC family protein [Candidatus Latescibacterota bacterium]